MSDSQALCIATRSQKLNVTFTSDVTLTYAGFTFKYFLNGASNSSICAAYVVLNDLTTPSTITTITNTPEPTTTTTQEPTTQNPCIIVN